MRKLYFMISTSLDGLIDSAGADPAWVMPNEELHRHFNDLGSATEIDLYGRRMYEQMAAYWPTAHRDASYPSWIIDFAKIWQHQRKVVFSSTLREVSHNARLVQTDAVAEVTRLKSESGGWMGVSGTSLASSLAAAGLIDEYRFYMRPSILGQGTHAFEILPSRVPLQLMETRSFSEGVVLLRYASVPRQACI